MLLLSLVASAATVTATIDAWNSASLSGDVTPAMTVQFMSSTKSGAKITADHSARLTLSGLPACTVQAITLYVRSNTSAGAATVVLSMAGRTWLAASGNYSQWPGMSDYSTVSKPLTCLSDSLEVAHGDSLTMLIEGTTNSIYIDQVVVRYTLAPPVSHVVTLQWMSQSGIKSEQIAENSAGEGIDLPSVPAQDSIILLGNETWYWLGWTETNTGSQSSSPLYWQTNDWYGPEDDCTLYALYTNAAEYTLKQDSSFTNGEYAIVRIEATTPPVMFVLAGAWKSGRIDMQSIALEKNEQQDWVWRLTQLNDNNRYQLTFMNDSVTIYHPQSQSGIGYSSASGSNNCKKWAWKKAAGGTIFLYGSQTYDSQFANLSFTITSQDVFQAVYAQEPFFSNYPYWRLFPVSSVPSNQSIKYTTFADVAAQPVLHQDGDSSPCRKMLDTQGQIVIFYNNHYYNLFGQPL